MAEVWTPRPEAVAEIVQLLEILSNPSQAEHQEQAQQRLSSFEANPEFSLYLAHMMAHPLPQVNASLRQLAGLVLKNQIKSTFRSLPVNAQSVVRKGTLLAARDHVVAVRHTAGTVVTTLVSVAGLSSWGELLPAVVGMLESGDLELGDGALDILVKLCEDSAPELDSEELGRPLNQLVPLLLSLFGHPRESFRVAALRCINSLIHLSPQALLLNMDAYLEALSKLARDECPQVRKGVCQAMVLLVEMNVEYLLPNMHSICEFMLAAQQDPCQEVSIEAGDFWMAYCDRQEGLDILLQFLPRLIPVLVSCVVYSADQIAEFNAQPKVDEHMPDAPEDIRPMFYRSKGGGGDDDEDSDGVAEWNLRKCAAAALDNMSGVFGPEYILPALLPALEERLGSPDVWQRESAMLALGAASEGCLIGLDQHLPQLFSFLLSQLSEDQPQLRSIACWVLGRFVGWIVRQNPKQYLEPLLKGLMERVLDSNKKVQEAACSAMSTIEEEVGYGLQLYLEPLLSCFAAALAKYQVRSLIVLYDTIGTLADHVGERLACPSVVSTLLPPLMTRWNQLADTDRVLMPALECLTSLLQAVGGVMEAFIRPIFVRCLRLIEETLVAHAAAEQPGFQVDPPDKELVVCALDVLSGMAEGLGEEFESLVGSSNLISLLLQCCADESVEVRQSAFAVVGELAKSCMPRLLPALPQMMEFLVHNLSSESALLFVCNNASWAIGEIAATGGREAVAPWVSQVMARLLQIIRGEGMEPSLLENTSITVGRLGLVCPESLAPELDGYCAAWCSGLALVRNRKEKEAAFQGLCLVIQHNPNGVANAFGSFCQAVGSWHDPNPEVTVPPPLADMFRKILQSFKAEAGDQWEKVARQLLPPDLFGYLAHTYQL